MALQVWLPLNGNFNHQGVSAQNAAQTCTNATFDDGKLGKCLHVKGSAGNKNYYAGLVGATKFSICCWMKINEADKSTYSAYQDFFSIGCNADGSNSDAGIRIEHRAAGLTAMQTELYRNSSTMGGNSLISTYQCDIAAWTHIVITFDGNNARTYKNGTLVGTLAKSSIYTTSYNLNGYLTLGMGGTYVLLNDFRIYDHCLSQQEVREISKGLILHYPLDTFKGITGSNVNLAKGNYSCYTTSAGSTTSGSATFDTSIASLNSLIGKTLTFSFYYSIEGAKQNTDTSDWSTYRYGIHLTMVGVQGGTTKTTYPCANYLTMSGTGRAVQQFTIPSDYTSISSLSFSIQPRNKPASGNSATWYLKQIKMELGNVATDWCPNQSDPEYNQLGYNDATIYDCSGFGNNGEIRGSGTTSVDTSSPRYSADTLVNGSAITLGTYDSTIGKLVSQPFTVSFWVYPVSNTSFGVNALLDIGRDGLVVETTRWFIYNSSHTATVKDGSTVTLNTWNHIAVSFDGTTVKMYKNGASTTSITGVPAMAGSGVSGLNARFANTYCNFNNRYSDVRFYATALSADDVKLLYNRGASIDNAGNLHCGELVEDNTATKQQVKKNTQVKSRYFSELPLKYDDTIYVEPDGSMWVRIVRQNNPTSNKFASTDSFTTSVYKSVNTWFYASFCNYVDKWELMVKQFIRNATSETKYRWVQQYNPMTATYANVARANITYNTSSGYATPASTYGGLYNINTNTKLCANNNTSGNWFGAIGSWSAHDGGIPGWNNTVVTTGYEDLYLRIDNVTFVNLPANTKTQFLKSGDINSTEIYEQ